MAALAVDREAQEGIVAFALSWTAMAAAHEQAEHEQPSGRPSPDAAPGTAPAAASADVIRGQIERLRQQLAGFIPGA